MYQVTGWLSIFEKKSLDFDHSDSFLREGNFIGSLARDNIFMLIDVVKSSSSSVTLKVLDATHNICGWTADLPEECIFEYLKVVKKPKKQ